MPEWKDFGEDCRRRGPGDLVIGTFHGANPNGAGSSYGKAKLESAGPSKLLPSIPREDKIEPLGTAGLPPIGGGGSTVERDGVGKGSFQAGRAGRGPDFLGNSEQFPRG